MPIAETVNVLPPEERPIAFDVMAMDSLTPVIPLITCESFKVKYSSEDPPPPPPPATQN